MEETKGIKRFVLLVLSNLYIRFVCNHSTIFTTNEKRGDIVKNWQVLIGLMAIAIAILISGMLISNAIQEAGSNIHVGFTTLGELIR